MSEKKGSISYPFEPFKIKTIERISVTTRKEREKILRDAHGNIFAVPARAITIDLLTDSGTGAMSDAQWGALMQGDESYASSKSWEELEAVAREIFGMPWILPVHQGRGAEHLLFNVMLDRSKNPIIPGNGHFDTTMGHIDYAGGTGVDCIGSWADDPESDYPFKGDIDVDKLRDFIENAGVERVPMVLITITANTAAGQPVSLKCMKDVRKCCDEYGIPVFFDAARFAENAYFIKTREEGMAKYSVGEIVKMEFDLVDGATMSSKKDGLVNIGGLVVCRDKELYRKLSALCTLFEGFPTYGGQAGRDIAALAVGLREVLDEKYLDWRIGQTRYLGERLAENGVPIIHPVGGHAVYINISKACAHMPLTVYPGIAFQNEVYLEGGVRVCEIGTVLAGRDPSTGEDRHPRFELLRLAIPRRVYTRSHMDYVIDIVSRVYKNRINLNGVRFVYEPPVLRHFTAEYEEIATADSRT
ncbi:MAG: tryptophanase [bacterium]